MFTYYFRIKCAILQYIISNQSLQKNGFCSDMHSHFSVHYPSLNLDDELFSMPAQHHLKVFVCLFCRLEQISSQKLFSQMRNTNVACLVSVAVHHLWLGPCEFEWKFLPAAWDACISGIFDSYKSCLILLVSLAFMIACNHEIGCPWVFLQFQSFPKIKSTGFAK